jgi:hypothetical protein
VGGSQVESQGENFCKYYVFERYSSSRLYLKFRSVYLSKHSVSETGFCLRLQVRPTQLGPIDIVPISGDLWVKETDDTSSGLVQMWAILAEEFDFGSLS